MISIAIDGPSGSGKSSISKVLAKKLGFISLDTGALYRTIAYFLKTRKINYEDENTVAQNLQDINMNLRYLNSNQRVFLNDKDVTNVIRSEEISMISSRISAMPCIRNYLLEFQRNMAKKHNIKTIQGLDMLIYQGAKAFEIWTGKKPDTLKMKIAALEAMVE